MPDTTERWPTPVEFANRVMASVEGAVGADYHGPLRAGLIQFFTTQEYEIERKLSRLVEGLKGAIEREVFGPLFIDENGERIDPATVTDPNAEGIQITQAYQIWRAFRAIYSEDVLDSVDMEGDPLE